MLFLKFPNYNMLWFDREIFRKSKKFKQNGTDKVHYVIYDEFLLKNYVF